MGVTGNEAVTALAQALRAAARATRQRRVLLFDGDAGWCRSAACAALDGSGAGDALWMSGEAPPGRPSLAPGKARALLGRELDTLVIDAHSGFDPDAFGAASGSLQGGGLLLLLTPPLAQWPSFPDPQLARIAVYPWRPEQVRGRFLLRLARLLAGSDDLVRVEQHGPVPVPPGNPEAPSMPRREGPFGSDDQERVVEALCHLAAGHHHRPLVITADRGRGKSSAYGLAAARLLLEAPRRILVTAPRAASLDSLFTQARHHLPGAETRSGRLAWNGGELCFVAPDELVRNQPDADLLLVDEAAGIPMAMLEVLLDHYPRVAFASTVHGYEGTGRGFALRFRKRLDARAPGWRALEMTTPIRWAEGDPLERLVYRCLLLDAGRSEAGSTPAPAAPDPQYERLDRDALTEDEPLLAMLFGLLVQAHYRTRPYDLRHLLDGPNVEIHVLRQEGLPVATALLAREGGLPDTLAQAVFEGRRRVQGHLLPQSLVANLGLEDMAGLRYGRVMRIAVRPERQGRGLGSRLLAELDAHARGEGLDWLGTSFGMTPALLDFWSGNGYRPVRVGMRREASSGSESVLMLRPVSERARAMMQQIEQRFHRRLAWQLSDCHRDLDPELVVRLWREPECVEAPDSAADWREIRAFAFAHRGLEDSGPALERLVRERLEPARGELAPSHVEVLVRRLLEHQDWNAIAGAMGFRGRGEALAAAREAVGELVRLAGIVHLSGESAPSLSE